MKTHGSQTVGPQVVEIGSFTRAISKTGKAALLLLSVAVLLTGGAAAVRGQAVLDSFDPNANGRVNVVVVQPDGKILLGGEFTALAPNGGATVARNYIARLNADGTLDTAFDPNVNGTPIGPLPVSVSSIALQADGKILVGGLFNSVGGQTRNHIARLDPTTGSADSWDPNAIAPTSGTIATPVSVITVQADGRVLVGGFFTSIGGQARNHMARLDAVTGLADSLNPNPFGTPNGPLYAIAVQTDGKILTGGQFTSIGGQTRNRIARLDPTTGLADSFDPNANNIPVSIVPQTDGKILVAGQFSSIGGQLRNNIARLDATTGLADSFDPNANSIVFAVAVQADGKVLAGGFFSSIGGQTRNRIARLDTTTGLADTAYNPNANSNVSTIAVQADGKVLVGGLFTFISGQTRNRIARLVDALAPTPTPTPAPTPALVNISGTITYCSNPSLNPVPDVTLTLTGTIGGSTLTGGPGNYVFASLPTGGTYTVTPTKAAMAPASPGITTVDVLAVQRHFLNFGTPLTGCKLTAADVNGDTVVNAVDFIAVQRFALGLSTGVANTGKYKFTPASISYSPLATNMTGQNYDALVFGDVASGFVHRPDGPSQTVAGQAGVSDDEVLSTVTVVTLPEVAVDHSKRNFIVAVKTSDIDAKNRLVGFQGDFTFDERMVAFQTEPVQKAGITSGNWNVSGNVLDGMGPIRTLRISAYSNDFAPLSGSGTLFELRMTRVSRGAQGTQLVWAAPPDQFIFIDADLKTQEPGYAASGGVTSSR